MSYKYHSKINQFYIYGKKLKATACSAASKERNEKYTDKIIKLKQEIQLSVENDTIFKGQIYIQLYTVKLQHPLQLFVNAMINIHDRAAYGIFLNTVGESVFTYNLTYDDHNHHCLSQHTVMILYILVLYLILIFLNQNNLKQQQQVSIIQTVKLLLVWVLWLLIYINEHKPKKRC